MAKRHAYAGICRAVVNGHAVALGQLEVGGDGVLTPLCFDVVFDGCGTIDELASAIAGLNLK